MAIGMLPTLFGPQAKDARLENLDNENHLMNLAQTGPFGAAAYTSYQGGQQAGQGLGKAVGGALGLDTRTPVEKNQAAIEAAKAQVSQLGFNPDDPKSMDTFYKQVIQILQKQQLTAEAMQVAQEWHAQKRQDTQLDLQNAELQRKREKDAAQNSANVERNRILAQRLGKMGDPVIQLLNQLDALDPNSPADQLKREAIKKRLDALSKGMGIKIADLGDRVQILDAATGQPIGEEQKGAAPMNEKDAGKKEQQGNQLQTAYEHAKLQLQRDYDAAVDLYNDPGLKDAVGPVAGTVWKGSAQEEPGFGQTLNRSRLSRAGQAAGPRIMQVRAGTFLSALQQLKSASKSPTGATGLGSLTETEGAKIQNATAALDPQQYVGPFRARLSDYISLLVQEDQLLDAAARRDGVTVSGPLRTKPLRGGSNAPAAPQAAPAAPEAPAAPAATPVAAPAPVAPPSAPKTVGGRKGWSIEPVVE